MSKPLLVLVLLAATVFASTPTMEDSIFVLTDSNFNDFIRSRENVLVEFYAPWCGHCKKLAPEYTKAANTLAKEKSTAVLAKVDATEQKELATRFSIKGFPTMKFFSGNPDSPLDYSAGRTEKDIVGWIKKRTGEFSELITSPEALKSFLSKSQVTVIYFGESESDPKWQIYKSVAMAYTDISFGHVLNTDMRTAEGASDLSLVLYKQFDELRNNFSGEFTPEAIKKFIDDSSFPSVIPFNEKSVQKIFHQGNPTIFLFAGENDSSMSAEAAFQEAARINKGKVVFSISKPNDGFGQFKKLGDYIGADTDNPPEVILVHSTPNEVLKYRFTSDKITVETISDFISRFLNGQLTVHRKTEEPPATNSEPVKVIVGKTFDEMVSNSSQDVLIEFYAPWCGHCKKLTPIFETVAKKLSHNKNLLIAKVDATANEIPGMHIKGFPTLKFFPNGKKSSPIDFEGERTEEGIMKYLKEKTTYPWMEAKDEL